MVAGCIGSLVWTNSFTEKIIEMTNEVEQAFTDNDTETAIRVAKELRDEWDKFLNFSIFANDLGHTIELTSAISDVYAYAQENNEELYASCDRVEAQIKLFKDMQTPTIWKIL